MKLSELVDDLKKELKKGDQHLMKWSITFGAGYTETRGLLSPDRKNNPIPGKKE